MGVLAYDESISIVQRKVEAMAVGKRDSESTKPAPVGRFSKRTYDLTNNLKEKASSLSFEQVFEKSVAPAKALAATQVDRIRERNPEISTQEILEKLETRFVSRVTSTGVATGAAAAVPGAGTLAAISATLGDAGAFITATMVQVFSVLKALDAELVDVDHERALILTVLAGGSTAPAVQKVTERVGPHWGKALLKKIPGKSLKPINKILGRNFVTKYGTKQGVVVLGKWIPFGIGAAVGGGMNYIFAKGMIKATRVTFVDMFEGEQGMREAVNYMQEGEIPGGHEDGDEGGAKSETEGDR